MWNVDDTGREFPGTKEALRFLQNQAEKAIAEGDRSGSDVRGLLVRVRDESGNLLFEGTMDEASRLHIDGRVYVAAP